MATYFFRNVGTSYNTGTNWSLTTGGGSAGIVPSSLDTIVFDANSGNCTQDLIGASVTNLSFANYAGTFTVTNNIVVTGDLSKTGVSTATANSAQILVAGNITITTGTLIGTTEIVLNGTGTWSGSNILGTSLTINTAGTITVSGTVVFYNGTLLYTAGTVSTAGSTLLIGAGVSATINSNGSTSSSATTTSATGINWNNVTSSGVLTNSSALCVVGNLNISSFRINGSTVYVNGNFTGTSSGAVGTALVRLQGTACTWSTSTIQQNVTIDTAGTVTMTGTIQYYGSTLTYVAGNTDTTGSTFIFSGGGTVVLNTSGSSSSSATTTSSAGINFNNLTFSSGAITNNSNLCVVGTFATSSGSSALNGSSAYLLSHLTLGSGANLTGSATVNLIGTGTWSSVGGSVVNNLVFNTSGTITVSGVVIYVTGTMTYTAGTVITTGSTLKLGQGAGAVLNTNGIVWNNVQINGGTITNNSTLTMLGEFSSTGSATGTINGSAVIVGGSLTSAGSGAFAGTSVVTLNGTGTVSVSGVAATIQLSITINSPSGTITFSGTIFYNTGTITYTSGIVITTSSTLEITGNCTLNTVGISWNSINGNSIVTNNSTLSLIGTITNTGGFFTLNGSDVNCSGSINGAANGFIGTSLIILNGTGTWSGKIFNNLTLNSPSGTITVSGTVTYGTGIFTYTRGAVEVSLATLTITISCTFVDIYKLAFGGGVTFTSGITVTMNKFFEGLGNLPCRVRPSTSGNMTVVLTSQSESHFTSIQNVLMSASSPYRIMMTTINSDKGGNAGVIFMSQQLPQGFVDQDWIDRNWEPNGYYKQWGETPIGFVRNE